MLINKKHNFLKKILKKIFRRLRYSAHYGQKCPFEKNDFEYCGTLIYDLVGIILKATTFVLKSI